MWSRDNEKSGEQHLQFLTQPSRATLCSTDNIGVLILNNLSKATLDLLWPVTCQVIIFRCLLAMVCLRRRQNPMFFATPSDQMATISGGQKGSELWVTMRGPSSCSHYGNPERAWQDGLKFSEKAGWRRGHPKTKTPLLLVECLSVFSGCFRSWSTTSLFCTSWDKYVFLKTEIKQSLLNLGLQFPRQKCGLFAYFFQWKSAKPHKPNCSLMGLNSFFLSFCNNGQIFKRNLTRRPN